MLYLAPMTGLPPCPHCGQHHAEDVLLCPNAEKLIPLAGRVLDGKFRFEKQLGEGGMGAVWACENILVKKTVAIKLMHVQFSKDEGVLGRFRNEATAAGRIGSKHICDILDLGRSQLGPYIVMEMLHGADFAGFMQQRSAVDPGTIVMVMRQALEGLQAAHAAGIVHRDLKPENIFLHEPEPGQLLVKLMDFGISKFTEGEMAGKTGMGVLMGTPEYMSPEQTEGAAQADHRTDIWAMGVILYWALAGRNPFMGATMASTLINVTTREPTPISQAVPGIDPGLAAVVDRCLKKSPADRFESSEAMSAALEPFENLQGAFFVPFLSKSGTTGRGTSAPRTPPPGATVASVGPPQMRPPSGPPPAAPAAAAVPTPTPSSKSEDVMVLGAAGAGGGPTFSSELSGAPPGASPTMATGGDWGGLGDESDLRPDSNMGSGKGGFLVIALVALAVVAGGGYFAYAAMQEPDAKAVAASAAAKAEEQQAEAKAAEEAAKAAEEAEAALLPDVGAGDEAGDEAGEEAEGGAVVAGAEGGAAEGGAAEGGAGEGGAAEGGAAEGGAAEGGAAEGGADEGGAAEGGDEGGDAKPSGGGSKPSGGGSKPSGGGSKPSGGGSKPSGGGSKPSGGGSKPSDDDSGKGKLTPSKGPRDDTSAKKKKKKKKKGKKKKGKKNKKLSPSG